jgi:GDPmannose 4,6-dehydratase
MRTALITGITGQDGSYLAELLIELGYEVHGIVRRTSSLDRSRLAHLYADKTIYGRRLFLHYADLDDPTTLRRLITALQPAELYHLASQSHVGISFQIPETTCELIALGTLRLLEILRDLPDAPRLFYASSSEIFGQPREIPQTEQTPMEPVTPYGCAKAFATQMVRIYRQTHSLFAVNGILYNHESPRRGENFVTRKITRAAAAIKTGSETALNLGDLSAKRDWGYAGDYVRGMWLTLQHDTPDDYIFATGRLHSVREILEIAFSAVDLDWRGYVKTDLTQLRATEPARLLGDATKAQETLGWEPSRSFANIIREMVHAELTAIRDRAV